MINPSSDNQPAPQTPEQFAEFLRKRVQEAITASVHHASLSQQYMSLSQRFSALAEQASAGNVKLTLQAIQQLEREAHLGIHAVPTAETLPTSAGVVHPTASASMTPRNPAGEFPAYPYSADNTVEFCSTHPPTFISEEIGDTPATPGAPPVGVTVPDNDALPHGDALAADESFPFMDAPPTADTRPLAAAMHNNFVPLPLATKAPDQSQLETADVTPPKEKKRQRVSAEFVPENAKPVRLQAPEKVRVKAKESDLKQDLSSATEDLTSGLKRARRSTVISFVIHGTVLILLALRQLEFFAKASPPTLPIFTSFSDGPEMVEDLISIQPPADEIGEQLEVKVEEMIEMPESQPVLEPTPEPLLAAEMTDVSLSNVAMADASLPDSSNGHGLSSSGATVGTAAGGLGNRSEAGRKAMLKKFGGSAASESAVGFALEWLAARQRGNGTWDFIDVGPCTLPGSVNNPIGGTAYALLPFLAAGQTHKEGLYKKQVQAGLDFLTTIGVPAPAGYDLRGVVNKADDDTDPNYAYYVHGAATLALCEAYGMTKDRKLKAAAEGAVSFLVKSQDPQGGGWRYNPLQPGSTSATTIQVMALKAAEKSGIKIPDSTWKGVSFYLDGVSVDRNGRYGYEVQKKEYAMSVTSMALLSRMYLGWDRNDGDMRAGIALIGKSISTENYYTNYFATQVMKNWGGSEWERWNGRIRDELVARQETDGPGKGSWAPRDRADYSKSGGRLLTTCLATLTLEVYYRYQPLLPEITAPVSLENPSALKPPSPAAK